VAVAAAGGRAHVTSLALDAGLGREGIRWAAAAEALGSLLVVVRGDLG